MSLHPPWSWAAALALLAACGSSGATGGAGDAMPVVADAGAAPAADAARAASPDGAPERAGARFDGVTAVKGLPARDGWLVLLETLQTQLIVTVPARRLALLDDRLETVETFDPIEGWTLIDAVSHPSGDVSAVYLRVDYADPFPLRIRLVRHRPDGARVDTELPPVAPSDPEDLTARFVASYDRARLAAHGEDLFVAARWSGNAVWAYRLSFGGGGFRQEWASRVEPEAEVLVLGIIGGGFDNFRQGDSKLFVYLDVDEDGNAYVAVPSTLEVLEAHDLAFGEELMAGADPESFDFGTAILTRLDAGGARSYARLLGTPGRYKRLLSLRAGGGSVLLAGRVKTGTAADSWDAWLLSAAAASGAPRLERAVDVEHGDMFWDAAPLPGGRVLAVGSSNYTQNPSGLSVSDERDALALLLDERGEVARRLDLPRGGTGRGDEAMSVRVDDDGRVTITGMLDGPGTHAEVWSDGFLDVRSF